MVVMISDMIRIIAGISVVMVIDIVMTEIAMIVTGIGKGVNSLS
ncbi:hypothetical protein [Acinetobacter guillouiae]